MMMSSAALPDALYYLRNFRQALCWVVERNQDLLSDSEQQFLRQFDALPMTAQALLARLSMRRGEHFRGSKIRYQEIEPLTGARDALVEIEWLDPRPALTLQDLFRLCTRAELAQRFGRAVARLTKQAAYEALIESHEHERSFQEWLGTDEPLYHVAIAPMVLQFRLLHFGCFYQEWHEYTLAHLQIFKYEPVPLDRDCRPFESRADIEFFYALYRCHVAMREAAEVPELLELLPDAPAGQGWLRRRWDRLRYHIGQAAEREQEPATALEMYRDNSQPEAKVREVRLLELLERDEEALQVAQTVLEKSSSEWMTQRVTRVVSRLRRRQGAPPEKRRPPSAWITCELQLDYEPDRRVEIRVLERLSNEQAPAYYVENSLLCSLFGLLCWDAIFAPVRGAFFHPFQAAPADLHCPDFVARRGEAFGRCLRRLDGDDYVEHVLRTFALKHGTRAPFVHWLALDEPTLQLALRCIPAEHLKLYVARMLDDLNENTSGFPDLVQFFRDTSTYKWIEVKGPGDRLQDNQRRWLQFCTRHQLPVEVCHVRWASEAGVI